MSFVSVLRHQFEFNKYVGWRMLRSVAVFTKIEVVAVRASVTCVADWTLSTSIAVYFFCRLHQ